MEKPEVSGALRKLHEQFVVVSADKAANNVILICKQYYIEQIRKELLGIDQKQPAYQQVHTETAEEIVDRHRRFCRSNGVS